MAISVTDTTYSVIAETVAGTIPATPAFLSFEYTPGTVPVFQSDNVVSTVLKANRASAGSRKTNYNVGGGLATQLGRDPAVEALMAGALSGTWASTILKASNVNTNYTIEEKKVDGANSYYQRFSGCQMAAMNMDCAFDGTANLSFDIVGMNRTTATSIVTGATYSVASTKPKIVGLDVTSVVITGLTGLVFTSATLKVSHTRESQGQFGSATARAVGTSGFRTVTLDLVCYRTDFAPDTLSITDAPVNVVLTMSPSAAASGYEFRLPAAYLSLPTDSTDGSKALLNITCTASYDTTLATDFQITRLA